MHFWWLHCCRGTAALATTLWPGCRCLHKPAMACKGHFLRKGALPHCRAHGRSRPMRWEALISMTREQPCKSNTLWWFSAENNALLIKSVQTHLEWSLFMFSQQGLLDHVDHWYIPYRAEGRSTLWPYCIIWESRIITFIDGDYSFLHISLCWFVNAWMDFIYST